jgi:hypothetical protein
MKTEKKILLLSVLILILAAVAAGAGVFAQGHGSPAPFTTLRGETVMIQGRGLYRYDSLSGASQLIGGDVITLLLGLPLLLLSILLARGGSLRGKLLLTGTLGYFLYTYISLSFLAAYNQLFLVYVALFSLSLFAFVLSLTSFDLKALPSRFSERLPRVPIAVFFFLLGGMLTLMWAGGIVLPSLLTGTPPYGLESYTTLVIQALDLGLIVPTAFVAGVLLLQRKPFGYLLAAVLLIKAFTMSAALIAMIIGQLMVGVPVGTAPIVIFSTIAVVDSVLMVLTLRAVRETPGENVRKSRLAPA